MEYVDDGSRCDRHIGEAFPPRCANCQAGVASAVLTPSPQRVSRYIPNSECAHHRGWPMPCDRCAQLDQAVSR